MECFESEIPAISLSYVPTSLLEQHFHDYMYENMNDLQLLFLSIPRTSSSSSR